MNCPCIALASGIGAGNEGCGKGPIFLKQHLQEERLIWKAFISLDSEKKDKSLQIADLNLQLAKASLALAEQNQFFLSFGGDHSSAIGTWSGVSEGYRKQGDIGLIWIDAHMDAHTMETTPSGNLHGMPLAALLGEGDPKLTQILSDRPKVKPEHVALIGIRSFEEGEEVRLRRLGVRIYYIEEVEKRGFSEVFKEAVTNIEKTTIGYGISFDLDAIDPLFVNAVGTPVPNGLDAEEVLDAFSLLKEHPPLAFELVEYNPELDQKQQTFAFVERLLETLLNSQAI